MVAIFQTTVSNTFLNESEWILIRISLKFIPKDAINNIPAMIWTNHGWFTDEYKRHSALVS